MEIRSYAAEAAPKIDGRTIQGYGSVFEKQSRILYDIDKKQFFIEIISKGAITEELIRSCDIKALLEHNKQRLLARSNMGSGSLLLSVDDYGLAYKFEAPNTQEGNDTLEMINRGDLFGSSFSYWTDEKKNVTYQKKDGIWLRTVHKIDRLFDIAIVSDPAYFGTDVTVRSLESLGANDDYINQINNLRKLI
nr:HK97 family phage prohead protease [uncultured Bacteroides sp.]